MAKIKFTDKTIKSLQNGDKPQVDFWDESMPGFGLRVSKTRKTWFVFYRLGKAKRRLSLGTYPTIKLVDARQKARDAQYKIANNIDPSIEIHKERFADTFTELANEYIQRHAKPNKKSWKGDQRILDKDILPYWGRLKAKDITRRDVIQLIDQKKETAPVLANRVLALVRKVFNFGIERDIVVNNPCHMVKMPTNEKIREGERVLSFEEIRKVWAAIEQQAPHIAGIFKMRLLTAQRGLEIRSMEWSEIDFESALWTMPGSKAKNGRQHIVPLSKQAVDLLKQLRQYSAHSRFVFPSPRGGGANHINNITKATLRINDISTVHFTDRDLRRTVASHMTAHLKVMRSDVSRILNHTEGGITRIYDRYTYIDEKREILQKWAGLL